MIWFKEISIYKNIPCLTKKDIGSWLYHFMNSVPINLTEEVEEYSLQKEEYQAEAYLNYLTYFMFISCIIRYLMYDLFSTTSWRD